MWVSFPCRVPRGARGVKMECIDQKGENAMDNQEMLNQIAAMLEQQHAETKEEIIGIKLMIENEVTQRLDALTDSTS